jgi:hypothetical protein
VLSSPVDGSVTAVVGGSIFADRGCSIYPFINIKRCEGKTSVKNQEQVACFAFGSRRILLLINLSLFPFTVIVDADA